MKKVIFSLVVASFFVLLQGCSTGMEMASNYVAGFSSKKNIPTQKLYVCLPQTVLHTNSSAMETPGFDSLSPESQEFLIAQNSTFLNKINDSIILGQFNEHFLYNLSLLGMPMFVVASPNEFPMPDSNNIFTIEVAQIEAQEFVRPRKIEYKSSSEKEYFSENVDTKGFSLNAWFLFNEKDASKAKLYYKNFEITDKLSANINPDDNNSKAQLSYKIKEINLNDVYYTAYGLGKMSATLFVEKLINDYVDAKIKDNQQYYVFNTEKASVDNSYYKSEIKESYFFQELPLNKK